MLKLMCVNGGVHRQTNVSTVEFWNGLVSTDWLVDWFSTLRNNCLIERMESVFDRTSELGLKSPAEYIMQNSRSLNYKIELALR